MRLIALIGLVTVCSLASCATVMTGKHDVIVVNSSPSGAHFTTDTGGQGTTPAKLEVPDNIDVRFFFDMPGYQKTEYLAKKRMSAWVFGNILIGGIIGLVVDFASGGIHVHEDEINVTLPAIAP